MHVPPLLEDLLILLTASLPVVFACQKLGLPAVVGFVVTGMLIGPTSLGLVHSLDNVEALAEIGVMLLMFTIGLEFSLGRVARMRRLVLGAGGLQVGFTLAAVAAAAALLGFGPRQAVVFGFIASLSSTAVVLKLLSDRAELGTPHGAAALGILLFQDLSVLPMLLLLPGLASAEGVGGLDVALTLAGAVVGAGAIVFGARTLLPAVFRQVLRLRSRELFLGVVVLTCFGTAWLTASLGISLSIGAFLAGLLVSESEYSHQVVADVLPLRDLFSSVFFVSIGMLLDLGFVVENALTVVSLLAVLIFLKVTIAGGAVVPFFASPRVVLLTGLVLGQVGEFSFVIAEEARALGILEQDAFQAVLAASVFSMLLTPATISLASRLARYADIPGYVPRRVHGQAQLPAHHHVVIIGYGFNGRNLARVLRETSIPYCVVDFDIEATNEASEEGHPVLYGDATRAVVLDRVHVDRATVVVIAINDVAATRRIVRLVREKNPTAAIVVRTRYVSEIEELYRLGADDVIPEEMETSIELFARVLQRLDVQKNVIGAEIDVVRAEHYAMMREGQQTQDRIESIYELFTAATTTTHLLRSGSPAIGQTLGEIGLRKKTGATLIAVVRKGRAITNPSDEFRFEKGDILVILGNHAELAAAKRLLDPPDQTGAAGSR